MGGVLDSGRLAIAGTAGSGRDLVHYWHFNDLPPDTLGVIFADSSAVGGSLAFLMYQGEGNGYMDRVEGTTLNAWQGIEAGFGLRVRNPSDGRTLLIQAPAMGYKQLVLSYAVHRTTNGAREQQVQYSADGGRTWNHLGYSFGIGTEYTLRRFDLSAIPQVNDNPGLQFRILFLGDETTGDAGNNRFDNIRLDGVLIDPTNVQTLQEEVVFALHNAPNPFRNQTTISFYLPQGEEVVGLSVIDASGRVVTDMNRSFEGPGQHHLPFDASFLDAGVYWVRLVSSKSVITHPMMVVK